MINDAQDKIKRLISQEEKLLDRPWYRFQSGLHKLAESKKALRPLIFPFLSSSFPLAVFRYQNLAVAAHYISATLEEIDRINDEVKDRRLIELGRQQQQAIYRGEDPTRVHLPSVPVPAPGSGNLKYGCLALSRILSALAPYLVFRYSQKGICCEISHEIGKAIARIERWDPQEKAVLDRVTKNVEPAPQLIATG